jgi:hypothetical protein
MGNIASTVLLLQLLLRAKIVYLSALPWDQLKMLKQVVNFPDSS